MEFNAYKSGSSKNNFSFNFKLPNLKNLSKQYVILLGVIIFFVASAGIYLVYNKTLSTKEHAGSNGCRIKEGDTVNAMCSGTTMLQRKRILLCCPNKGCKFWKYEPAGEIPNHPLCKNNQDNGSNNDSNNNVKPKCNIDSDCPSNDENPKICHNGKCVPAQCSKNSDCTKNGPGICVDHRCIYFNKDAGNQPVAQASTCNKNDNGKSCKISKNGKEYSGTCYNGMCFNNNLTYKIQTSSLKDAQNQCKKLGGYAQKLDNGSYICVGCQNKPIAQAPLFCKPPQCTGSKACVSPGTTSPGTDCNWYICDPKGSGLWIKTNRSCTQPAPTTTTNNSTPTPTPTPSTTATPTPTPTSTTDQTATITITHTQAGQCTDLGYSANYTIKLTYGPEQATQTINYNLTVNLDNNIDPAWVNDVSNNGSVDANTKTINWQQASLDPNNNQATYTYKINFPTSALNQTFNNTAIVSYNSTQEQSVATTTTSCSNTNDTTPTITPTTTPVPNTGIFDNIALTGGILSTIIIGLLIGL